VIEHSSNLGGLIAGRDITGVAAEAGKLPPVEEAAADLTAIAQLQRAA
jgi:hypothetical protein